MHESLILLDRRKAPGEAKVGLEERTCIAFVDADLAKRTIGHDDNDCLVSLRLRFVS